MKYFTEQQIEYEFSKLNRLKKIDILWEALDYMQQYNGRTRFDCIRLAMGYGVIEVNGKNNYFKKHD